MPVAAVDRPGRALRELAVGAEEVLRDVLERLVPGAETTAWFQFSTPKVRFAEPIVPLSSFDRSSRLMITDCCSTSGHAG